MKRTSLLSPLLSTLHSTLLLILLGASLLLSGCSRTQTFSEFLDETFREELSGDPLSLHYLLKDPDTYGIRNKSHSLTPYVPESSVDSLRAAQKMLYSLLSFPYEDLSTEEKLSYDILWDSLNTKIRLEKYALYEEPLSFSGGMQMELPILLAEYEFRSESDIQEYLTLLAQVDEYINGLLLFEKEKASAGLFMSDDLCQKTIDSCEAFLKKQKEHYLVTTFSDRLNTLSLSDRKKEDYLSENEKILKGQLFPAYERLIVGLSALCGSGKNPLGLCYFPEGQSYYEALVYEKTGCDDSIENLWERIETRRTLDLLLCSDLMETQDNLWASINTFSFSDESKALADLQLAMQRDFLHAKVKKCSFSYLDEALEEYLAPAFYITAPMDDYQNNTIYINSLNKTNDIYYFATLAHEGFPGHLYQTVQTYEYGLPAIRNLLNYSGWVEGWATYVEMLSYSYAGLDEDAALFLSHNQSATLSLYAASDIGLHYLGWDIRDMYEFWASYGILDTAAINEITQLILAEPGNYLSYYIGYLEFLDLKSYAASLFGEAYSDRAFHRAVLDIGPAPFEILRSYLPKYYTSF